MCRYRCATAVIRSGRANYPSVRVAGPIPVWPWLPVPVAVQPETLSSELLPEQPVFFAEAIDPVALLPVQPAGDGKHEQSNRVEGPAPWHGMAAGIVVPGSRNRVI